MDLNHLELSPVLLQDLYHQSLVESPLIPVAPNSEIEAAIFPEATTTIGKWSLWGKNQKGIVWIFSYPENPFIPDESFQFFLDILGACKLSMDDVAILNLLQQPGLQYQHVLKEFRASTCLLVGVEPASIGLPINFPVFQVQSFSNCQFLLAPTLEELRQDKVLKSKLWLSLRKIFGL